MKIFVHYFYSSCRFFCNRPSRRPICFLHLTDETMKGVRFHITDINTNGNKHCKILSIGGGGGEEDLKHGNYMHLKKLFKVVSNMLNMLRMCINLELITIISVARHIQYYFIQILIHIQILLSSHCQSCH